MYDKSAVITGGSDGIGRALVLELGELGYNVITIGRSQKKLDSLQNEFDKLSKSKLIAVTGDLTNDKDLAEFLNLIDKNSSRIDLLINNAGFQIANALLENADIGALDQMSKIHTTVPLQLYKTIYPKMKQKGFGIIINIVSVVVKSYLKETYGLYTVSKYAEYGLGSMMVKEASKDNVKVTNVILGGVDTNIREGSRAGYLLPSDVAKAIVGIIKSPEAVFIPEIYMWPKVQLS